ncbi:glyoxylate/hydroxypyruvate reductase A [Bosea sp. Root483D1]|uniref:2-hydroxyacid dehydrogenase n=1 Tax=Bosea sp. Root483D1 TaxID=1736544 RepID=UPI00070D1C0E|nr:glyoxylate/hydroxypyruvate reductase A [Bosea sp. Root483D1]KRE12694.1 glyoxylate/hydroxypyruvate reductase A [Bosea sp. Root483D1]
MTLLLKSDAERGEEWTRLLAKKAPKLPFRIWPDIGDPAEVRYLAAWIPPDGLFEQLPNLELLISVGAGVDQLKLADIPKHLPIVRMIEPGLVDSMVEYVTMSVLALHRDLVPYIAAQREQAWKPLRIRPASERRVGVLGLGMLGKACALKLAEFGFGVAGWSRSRHEVAGIATFAGDDELPAFLARSDILICLLPLTDETRGLLGAELFARLPQGAMIVNAGRGGHLDQGALLTALDSGQVAAAVLDVCEPEPLPSGHPLWNHPAVLITPHIASRSRSEASLDAVIENLRRHRAGEPLIGLINRDRGY